MTNLFHLVFHISIFITSSWSGVIFDTWYMFDCHCLWPVHLDQLKYKSVPYDQSSVLSKFIRCPNSTILYGQRKPLYLSTTENTRNLSIQITYRYFLLPRFGTTKLWNIPPKREEVTTRAKICLPLSTLHNAWVLLEVDYVHAPMQVGKVLSFEPPLPFEKLVRVGCNCRTVKYWGPTTANVHAYLKITNWTETTKSFHQHIMK